MTETHTTGADHVDDGDLIRLHDGECSADEELLLRDHLAACRACHERFQTFTRLAHTFKTALQAMDEPTRARGAARPIHTARSRWNRRGL